ncbi:MAG: phosphopentomutase, partial [Desulfuromonas sp.]
KQHGGLSLPNLERLGLGRLAAIDGLDSQIPVIGGYGRMAERSPGKDSITGHWELAGLVLADPFQTFAEGFPPELVAGFGEIAGMQPLGNVSANGLSILKTFGPEHLRTGRPILYTSVDSVFQIAAHEEVIPLPQLYELCSKARRLVDPYRIGRVIARPFTGNLQEGFRRSVHRKDFAMPPTATTLLDLLADAVIPVVGVGKVEDLFAGRGLNCSQRTHDNEDGMASILKLWDEMENGLLLANLIDFDMVYGHRNDVPGFARAIEDFDGWLPELFARMRPGDLLMISADHGCDPTTAGSDHTREYVPILAFEPQMCEAVDLGTRTTFADAGATLAEFFGLGRLKAGRSFLSSLDLQSPE